MRGTNRHDRGRPRGAAGLLPVLIAAIPGLCLSSAAGPADWTRLEFTGLTHHGAVHVLITTLEKEGRFWVDQLKIDIDGKKLEIPKGVSLRLPAPRLFEVELTATRSVTCIEGCPDISGWPAWLDIPYGDYVQKECKYSWLQVRFVSEGITEISLNDCNTPDVDSRILYERK